MWTKDTQLAPTLLDAVRWYTTAYDTSGEMQRMRDSLAAKRNVFALAYTLQEAAPCIQVISDCAKEYVQ